MEYGASEKSDESCNPKINVESLGDDQYSKTKTVFVQPQILQVESVAVATPREGSVPNAEQGQGL